MHDSALKRPPETSQLDSAPARNETKHDATYYIPNGLGHDAMNGKKQPWKKYRFLESLQTLLVGGFALIILLGAILLWLPVSHQPGRVGFFEALFTSTSAVCVTGLTVVDTGTDFTIFGQIVILLLIQTGGLGIMTFAALLFQLVGRRMSLRSMAVLQDSFFQRDVGGEFKRLFIRILLIAFMVELGGATMFFISIFPRTNTGYALYSAIFHSISAFCNAGFSIYRTNLMEMRDNPFALFTICSLIVLGGLGHSVLYEIGKNIKGLLIGQKKPSPHRFSFHARVVFRTTAFLILSGVIGFLTFGLTTEEGDWINKLSCATFQSITARTAGFNTVNIGALPLASLLLMISLMFVGGSPSSCAGGIKTTSFAIWIARLRRGLGGEREVRLMGRRISSQLLRRTAFLISLSVLWNMLGLFILLNTERHNPVIGLHDVLFEQISAFGTVGLSTGVTTQLSKIGRIWIILTMFVGRLGPLTLATWVVKVDNINLRYPAGRLMIG